ncbi:acyl transferase/acyl hydrolase/lysophospholipase [Talaromyces proteolyticus]|uniref:Acyl transferase/acyl hydrolase/lysophospholipase n=1 Tax=Talaromyces proteolyticus TaxID=1131652 RepID=A0AAD4KRB9_9EURO|nr:acyl transferase/acyl hydrolase/lysophospholipase [Talaromyces proteolyticus]KAH8693887.1 acyl transferase/acyl hydrolase/lysophospholipase [Talaromyces proteolyticus]
MADPWDEWTLLSIDGGGVRGFASLLFLKALMREIARVEENDFLLSSILQDTPGADTKPGSSSFYPCDAVLPSGDPQNSPYLPCHYFDFIVGSGTGGLIALMLGRLRMTAYDACEQYIRFANRVYGRPRTFHCRRLPPLWAQETKYNTYSLDATIREISNAYDSDAHVGLKHTPLAAPSDICKTIVTACGKRTKSSREKTYLFRSYNHFANKETGSSHRNPSAASGDAIWEVGHATMAAPSYFEKLEIENLTFKHGGMRVNNATEDVLDELQVLESAQKPGVVVSLGTGARHHTSIGNGRIADLFASFTGFFASMVDTDKVHKRVKRRPELADCYFRFNDRSRDWNGVIMDQWIPTYESERKREPGQITMDRMANIVAKYLESGGQEEMAKCAEQLVRFRRRRLSANPDRWERFASVSTFTCPECPNIDSFTNRSEFKNHIEQSFHKSASFTLDNSRQAWSYHERRRSSLKIPDPYIGSNEYDVQWVGEQKWEYRTIFSHGNCNAEAAVKYVLRFNDLETLATVSLN